MHTPGNDAEPRPEAPRGVLTPVERLSEILFGFIMTLSLTGTISVVSVGRGDVVTMLISVLGCNLAWGAIDGVLYALTSLSERGRNLRLYRYVREASDPQVARSLIEENLPPIVASTITPEELNRYIERIRALPEPPAKAGLTIDDLKGAVAVCLLVFSSCIPLIIPFLFVKEPILALRISNGIALVSLFLGGYFLARYAGFAKVRAGIVMMVLGVVLVAITIQLGG
jgi:hypothetical protein